VKTVAVILGNLNLALLLKVVSDGAEDDRAEPGSERNAGGQTNIFPSTVIEDRS